MRKAPAASRPAGERRQCQQQFITGDEATLRVGGVQQTAAGELAGGDARGFLRAVGLDQAADLRLVGTRRVISVLFGGSDAAVGVGGSGY